MDRRAPLSRIRAACGLLPSLVWLSAGVARAVAPSFISDADLAGSRVIVVARWDKAPVKRHDQTRKDPGLGNVITASEAHTTLHVLRTIRGNGVPVGDRELMIGWGVSWSQDGTGLSSGTSTELPGEVEDLTQPALWFLTEEPSWDEARPGNHLAINHYRRIQPLELEAYFAALSSGHPETELPKLLSPDKPEMTSRVLKFISGGVWPWPYEPDRFERFITQPQHRTATLKSAAPGVLAIVRSNGSGLLRSRALSVFADLTGDDRLVAIRPLLDDPDPMVRGTAIGLLVRHHDEVSLNRLVTSIREVGDSWLACKLIAAMQQWGDLRLVPSLITFLQNGGFTYQDGDDIGIPSLKARVALRKMTGHWFPADVERSQNAWKLVSAVQEAEQRSAMLQELIPGREFPLIAELIGKPIHSPAPAAEIDGTLPSSGKVSAKVRVRNVTDASIRIAKRPMEVSLNWPSGCSSDSGMPAGDRAEPDDFAILKPAESLEFIVDLNEDFLLADPAKRILKLAYYDRHRSSFDPGIWLGVLHVLPGDNWKEPRVVAQVEDLWPNGNLKATGTTINGHKTGEWNYFNDQGDRIRIEGNGGTATCNPDHPANKGAGIPSKAKAGQ